IAEGVVSSFIHRRNRKQQWIRDGACAAIGINKGQRNCAVEPWPGKLAMNLKTSAQKLCHVSRTHGTIGGIDNDSYACGRIFGNGGMGGLDCRGDTLHLEL